MLDLDAYLRRIEYTGPLEPSLAALEALHRAHATHIPFENLDILLGRPISLDLGQIQAKLVEGRRGGYCFEQNTLLAAALGQLGFEVMALAARVRYRATQTLPRTHMLLRVEVDGSPWLADVGFGAEGPLLPVPFAAGRESMQEGWTYRVMAEGTHYVLQSPRGGDWADMYIFSLEPQHPIDFEMANHFTSTHPSSRFTQTLVVQRLASDARTILRNRELTVSRPGDVTTEVLPPDRDLLPLLAERFGLHFPSGTRFHVPSASPTDM